MEWAFSVEKIQNGGRRTQKALRVPLPLYWSRFLRGGHESFQAVWQTDLEVDFERTQNYCVELLAQHPRRMIIQIRYSMMLSACAGAAATKPSPGPHGKSSNLLLFSPCVWKVFPEYVSICRSHRQIETFTWVVRRALNAISDGNKTERNKTRVFPLVSGISQTRALSILGVTFQEVADLLHT